MYLSNIYFSVSIVFGSLTERSPLEADIASTLSPSEADMMMLALRMSPSETEVRFRMNNGGLDEVTAMDVIVFVAVFTYAIAVAVNDIDVANVDDAVANSRAAASADSDSSSKSKI